MDIIVNRLKDLGLPDKIGLFGGIRRKVAELLVEKCREMGEREFRNQMYWLVDEVVHVAFPELQDSRLNK